MRTCLVGVLLVLACSLMSATEGVNDSAAEGFDDPPLVFDLIRTVHKYETDGTGQTVFEIRARPLNEAGVQALGQIALPYLQSRTSIEIRRFEVTKPDGTVLPVDESKVQRLPAPVTASYPVYSDLYLLHIVAPALSPGDIVEYEIATHLTQPDTPGHFGVAYNFERLAPVVSQQLEIDVPAASPIRLHTREDLQPTIVEERGRRIYRWEHANTSPPEEEKDERQQEEELALDVELSSFDSWEEVGAWYLELLEGRAAPSPEILRLAKKLTSGVSGDMARIQAIYEHVARKYRYLGLSLGMARYQPQRPSEVLGNGYGDCKDKHTLLASLLEAAGFEAYPALISRSREINDRVPAPHQFNHMITALVLDGEFVWLDATSQVTPFRYLGQDLRDKNALVVGRNGTSQLERTPASLPFPTVFEMELDGEITEDGALVAEMTYRARGDGEFFVRSVLFANAPAFRTQFAETFLEQAVSRRMELDDFSTDDLTDTAGPLELKFKVRVPDYLKLLSETQELSHYLMQQDLPMVDDDEPSLDLKSTYQANTSFKVRLPKGFEARPPAKSELTTSFGSYTTEYSVEDGVLLAERRITITSPKVQRKQYREYSAFRASLVADDGQKFRIRQTAAARTSRAADASVEQLFTEGKRALAAKSYDEAAALLSQVVELEADHATAWFSLGKALVHGDRAKEGVEALSRQTEIDPFLEGAFGNLGWALEEIEDLEAAEAAYRRQVELYPLDRYANSRLGVMLEHHGRCDEAVAPLENAISLQESDTNSKTYLGSCLLKLGRFERAESVLLELVEDSTSAWELEKAGEGARQAGQLSLAVTLLARATELDPEHKSAFNQLGRTLMQLKKFEEAVSVLERQTEVDPAHRHAFNNLGRALIRLGRYEEALPNLERQIEINPDDAWAQYNLALALEGLGKTAEAIAAHKRNLEVNAEDPSSLAALVRLTPESDQVKAIIGLARESNPTDDKLRQVEVVRLLSTKDYAQAIDILHEILRDDPESGASYAVLAFCHSMLGQTEETLEFGIKALALMPDDAQVNNLVGMAYLQKGMYGQAIPHLEASKRLSPASFMAQDVLDYARSQVKD